MQAGLAAFGHKTGFLDGCKGCLAQGAHIGFGTVANHAFLVHIDKPLGGVAEDDRLFRAPGMGIFVLQAATGKEIVLADQGRDDALIGVALLALVVDHACRAAIGIRAKTGCVVGVKASVINGERDGR